jgi:hypothetical protein
MIDLSILRLGGIVVRMIITGRIGNGIVVGSILVVPLLHMRHILLLVHHPRPLHTVDTVQELPLIAHIHHVNSGITSLLVALQIILHTMINHLGVMIHLDVMTEGTKGLIADMDQ